MRWIRLLAIALMAVVVASSAPRADVKTQEKSLIKFEGMLGRVVGLFAGKAAKEGIVNTVAVKGNRKATLSDDGGQIIDLAEEKIYEINVKDKSYKVVTFADYRRQLEEARKKAAEQAAEAEPSKKEQQEAPEFEVDVDVKPTGQSRAINGFDCRQVIMTVTVRQKGKTLDEAGGIVMTADSWLAPTIAEMKEVADFDLRFLKAIGIDPSMAVQQMASAMAMYPGLSQAQSRLSSEKGKLDGTPVLSVVKFESVQSASQASQAEKAQEERPSGGVGGMLGGLGRRITKKKEAEPASGQKGRTTIMTTTAEVLSVSTSVAPADVAIPAGFRQK